MRGDSKQNRRFSDKESNLSEKANEIQKKKWKIVSYVTNMKSTEDGTVVWGGWSGLNLLG